MRINISNNNNNNNNNTNSFSLRGLRTRDVTAALGWRLQYAGFSANVYLPHVTLRLLFIDIYFVFLCEMADYSTVLYFKNRVLIKIEDYRFKMRCSTRRCVTVA
jgi:hypothetical protein